MAVDPAGDSHPGYPAGDIRAAVSTYDGDSIFLRIDMRDLCVAACAAPDSCVDTMPGYMELEVGGEATGATLCSQLDGTTVMRVDLNAAEGWGLHGTRPEDAMQKTADFAEQYQCVAAINTAYFRRSAANSLGEPGGLPYSWVVSDSHHWGNSGNTHSWDERGELGYVGGYLLYDGSWSVYADSDLGAVDLQTYQLAVPGNVLLVDDGVIPADVYACCPVNSPNCEGINRVNICQTLHSRTGLGYSAADNQLYWVMIGEPGVSYAGLAEVFLDLGVDWAVNLDGGGSSSMFIDSDHFVGDAVTPTNFYNGRNEVGAHVERTVASHLGWCRGKTGTHQRFTRPLVWTHPDNDGDNFHHFTDDGGWHSGMWTAPIHPRTVADVNGDGLADVVAFGSNDTFVNLAIANASGWAFEDDYDIWSDDFAYNDQYLRESLRRMADVDGDGKADVVAYHLTLDGSIQVGLSNGVNGFEPAQEWFNDWVGVLGLSHQSDHEFAMADVNGDGMDDAIGFGDDNTYVALSVGNCFEPASIWQSSMDYTAGWRRSRHIRTAADVDGDGCADIIGFGANDVLVGLSDCEGSFSQLTPWHTHFAYSDGWDVKTHPRFVADADGDSLADIIAIGTSRVYVARSTGAQFSDGSAKEIWTDDPRFTYSETREVGNQGLSDGRWDYGVGDGEHVMAVGDVTGDAAADLIAFGQRRVLVGKSQ
jgi:hypothetical protein